MHTFKYLNSNQINFLVYLMLMQNKGAKFPITIQTNQGNTLSNKQKASVQANKQN